MFGVTNELVQTDPQPYGSTESRGEERDPGGSRAVAATRSLDPDSGGGRDATLRLRATWYDANKSYVSPWIGPWSTGFSCRTTNSYSSTWPDISTHSSAIRTHGSSSRRWCSVSTVDR